MLLSKVKLRLHIQILDVFQYAGFIPLGYYPESYSRITFLKFPLFHMKIFSSRLTNLTLLLLQSRD
jgi:hypothetical protein